MEFILAMNEYKGRTGRKFPTWTDVLDVLHALGYERTATGSPDHAESSTTVDRSERATSSEGSNRSDSDTLEPMPQPIAADTSRNVDQPAQATKLQGLLDSVLNDPESWLASPSIHFGGRPPADLVGTEEEHKIVDLLQVVDQGLF